MKLLRQQYCHILFFIIFTSVTAFPLRAQETGHVQEGEVGIGLGLANYFGDLNPNAKFKSAQMAASLFFKKNINNYIAGRVSVSYARLGFSDKYNTDNQYLYRRNLSFNSNVWEASLQADFNFFYFMPGSYNYIFTPYLTLGVGAFSYDPYAYLQNDKYFLRGLGTEGQGSSLYPNRKPYKTTAISFPIGAGVKYALNERVSVGFEVLYRFTNTDYLDDVSTTFVDPSAFPPNSDGTSSPGFLLSDRSADRGPAIGLPGVARGVSSNKDHFVTAQLHVSFNIQSYKCPDFK